MKLIYKNFSTIIFALLFLLVGWYVSNYFSNSRVNELRRDLVKMQIKSDSLVILERGLYTKMVADTAKVKELNSKIKELELKIKKPKIIIEKKIVFDTIFTEVIVEKKEEGVFNFEDYYPTKDNFFIKYTASVDTKAESVKGKFLLEPLSLSSGIGYNDKNEYRINTKLPDFARLSSLDAISEPTKNRNNRNVFGFIFGAGYGRSFNTESDFLTMQTGVRLNKTYLFINAGTNETVGASLMLEF